jgi:hypothetical protein
LINPISNLKFQPPFINKTKQKSNERQLKKQRKNKKQKTKKEKEKIYFHWNEKVEENQKKIQNSGRTLDWDWWF